MDFVCRPAVLHGEVDIPGSKSHTIRAVAIASLADGVSVIREPLDSADTRAAVAAYRALGAQIEQANREWRVTGVAGTIAPPDNVIDVANSGTTMNVILGSCALLKKGAAVLTGDAQVRRRSSGALAASLNDLGARVFATRGGEFPPFVVQGVLRGGETTLEATSSQYLTSLLLNAPLADGDSTIRVPLLHEKPYVEMTLDWLVRQDIAVDHDWNEFVVRGAQNYRAFDRRIPADFSTATFFLAAGALGNNDVLLRGLDMNDTQGDRAVVDYLREMGARVEVSADGIRVRGDRLTGCELDLNATPDALPMMAALGCFAGGETRIVNVPQARQKETDRIAVMAAELAKLGARVRELPDGLVVQGGALRSATVDGHGDHRIVMALAVAASGITGTTTIAGAEAVAVTFPGFQGAFQTIGGEIAAK